MTKLDMIVIRALLNNKVEFDCQVPARFAKLGQVRLYRPVVGTMRWAVLFGHDAEDYGLDLGKFADWAMQIASNAAAKRSALAKKGIDA